MIFIKYYSAFTVFLVSPTLFLSSKNCKLLKANQVLSYTSFLPKIKYILILLIYTYISCMRLIRYTFCKCFNTQINAIIILHFTYSLHTYLPAPATILFVIFALSLRNADNMAFIFFLHSSVEIFISEAISVHASLFLILL